MVHEWSEKKEIKLKKTKTKKIEIKKMILRIIGESIQEDVISNKRIEWWININCLYFYVRKNIGDIIVFVL